MIGYINGKVIDIGQGTLLIENNGIGYEVSVSASAFERMTREKQGGIYTYLQVREDGISLFGFDTQAEKNMFLKLISVSGVGPKMGIGILSGMSLQDLAMSIATSSATDKVSFPMKSFQVLPPSTDHTYLSTPPSTTHQPAKVI